MPVDAAKHIAVTPADPPPQILQQIAIVLTSTSPPYLRLQRFSNASFVKSPEV